MGFLGVIALQRLKQQGDRGIWGNWEPRITPDSANGLQGFKDLGLFDFSLIKSQPGKLIRFDLNSFEFLELTITQAIYNSRVDLFLIIFPTHNSISKLNISRVIRMPNFFYFP